MGIIMILHKRMTEGKQSERHYTRIRTLVAGPCQSAVFINK